MLFFRWGFTIIANVRFGFPSLIEHYSFWNNIYNVLFSSPTPTTKKPKESCFFFFKKNGKRKFITYWNSSMWATPLKVDHQNKKKCLKWSEKWRKFQIFHFPAFFSQTPPSGPVHFIFSLSKFPYKWSPYFLNRSII